MKIRTYLLALTLVILAGSSFATDHYVSTQAEFNAVTNAVLQPGDAILLERGQQL